MLLSCYYQITSTILYHEQLDFIDKHYGNTNHNFIPGIKNSARSSSTHPRGNLIIIKYFFVCFSCTPCRLQQLHWNTTLRPWILPLPAPGPCTNNATLSGPTTAWAHVAWLSARPVIKKTTFMRYSFCLSCEGCAMSSVAMMLTTKGVKQTPGTLNSWLTSNGGYADGCDIYWGKPDAFGVTSFQGESVYTCF